MVGPRIFHVHQTRRYTGFSNPAAAFDAMNSWLRSSDFKIRNKNKTKNFSRGSKHGLHVNFVPKFKLLMEPAGDGSQIVKFDYYGKMKVGTLIVVGLLTSGISTAVGVATYTMRLLEADEFAARFWSFVDSLASGPVTIVHVERWGHDSHGHYTQQPVVVQQPVLVPQPVIIQQPYITQQAGGPYMQQQYPQPQQSYAQQPYPLQSRETKRELSGSGFQDTNYSRQGSYPQLPTQGYSTPDAYSSSTPSAVYGHPQPTYYTQAQFAHPPQPQYAPQQDQPLVQLDDAPQEYYPSLGSPSTYANGNTRPSAPLAPSTPARYPSYPSLTKTTQ